MDMLFQRYANPFTFVDMVICQNQFLEFVDNLIDKNNERYEWDYFLHKEMENISFKEFRDRMHSKNQQNTSFNFEATVTESKAILNSFSPQKKEDKNGII